jgi:hypothetical protein
VGDFVRLYKSFSLFALGAFVFHNLLLYFLAENSFILLLLSPLSELRWLFLFFIVGFVPIALYGQDRKNILLRIFSVGLWLLFFFYYVFFAAFAYLAWLMLFVFVLLIVFLYRRRLRLNLLTMLAGSFPEFIFVEFWPFIDQSGLFSFAWAAAYCLSESRLRC